LINKGYRGDFFNKEFVKCNDEIETKIRVMIEGEIKPNIFKYKFNYGFHKILLLIDDSLTDASCMFSNCNFYSYIGLSNFKTEKIKNMSYMFYGCCDLVSLDFSSFKTDNVTNMSNMFFNAMRLQKLDLSSFNTFNVKDMSKMFCEMTHIKSINVSSFRTDNVINMHRMFDGDCGITKLDLKSFKIDKVKNRTRMFYCCYNLKKIDLSNFKISDENQTNDNTLLSEMFDVVPASCKIICSDEKIIDKFNHRIKYTNDANDCSII